MTPELLDRPYSLAELRVVLDIRRKADAVANLAEFVRQAWHVLEPETPYLHGIHVDAICLHLQAVTEDRLQPKNLVLNVPPGHAKSLITAVFWPAWSWTRKPSIRWLFSSYRADLAERDSLKCRQLIDSAWYQSRWGDRFRIHRDQNKIARFVNDHSGHRVITSVGTGTGERGDIVCCDDPTSIDGAESDAVRTTANNWWRRSMRSRLNDQRTGHMVLIQQRCHAEDTTAVCLDIGGYTHVYLPQEYEPERKCVTAIWSDPRKERGELLWPGSIGPQQVIELKATNGSYAYAGQYQQRPAPAGGGILKRWWWRYWQPKFMDLKPVEVLEVSGDTEQIQRIRPATLPDEFDEQLQSWDMAFKDLKTSSYVTCGVWGIKGANKYLLDQLRKKMDFPTTLRAVVLMTNKWPKTARKLVEDKANGSAVIATLKHTIPGLIAVSADKSKTARAQAASPQIESGNVYIPHPAMCPWVDNYVEECAIFPNSKYSDQVDQTTQLLNETLHPALKPQPKRQQPPVTGDRGWMA